MHNTIYNMSNNPINEFEYNSNSGGTYSVCIDFGQYGNGRISMKLIDMSDGCPICTATVNVPEFDVEEDHVLIKTWSENEGIVQELIKANIIERVKVHVNCGHSVAAYCKLTPPIIDILKKYKQSTKP